MNNNELNGIKGESVFYLIVAKYFTKYKGKYLSSKQNIDKVVFFHISDLKF